VHNGLFGIRSDGTNGPVSTEIKNSAFFSLDNSGVTAVTSGANPVNVTYEDSRILNTGAPAIHAPGPSSFISLSKDVITGSLTGVAASGGGIVNLDNNVITGNGTGVSVGTGTVNSVGNNAIKFNGVDVSGSPGSGGPLQ
jgi:hypothetical protein